MSINPDRPLIAYIDGDIYHCTKAKVVHRPGMISVGCTDMTVDAARVLLEEHDTQARKFPADDSNPFAVYRHTKGQPRWLVARVASLESARIVAEVEMRTWPAWYVTIEHAGRVIDTLRPAGRGTPC